MDYKIDEMFTDISRIDGIEVDEIMVMLDENGDVYSEEPYELGMSRDNIDHSYWSVFTHVHGEGRECIADCPDENAAYFIAEALREYYAKGRTL